MNHDIPERYLKFSMEGNTAANILNKAADVGKKLFLDKIVEQMTNSIEDLLKTNLPSILDSAMQKDGVYAGVLGIVGTKGQGQQIYQVEMFGSLNQEEYQINGELKLSVPKLMILGILYSASSARTRAERFYELIQLDLEPKIY